MKTEGKTIWITGASSGIGEGLAIALAKKGCNLILSARRETELQRVKESCPTEAKRQIVILPLDLENTDSHLSKTLEAQNAFGQIDILINNGGISQRSMAMGTSEDVERKIMEVNYFGTISLTKCVLSKMMERKSGQIVTVSSLVGKFGTPFRSSYSASKHALHGYIDSLRTELFNSNIIFTLICPGFVRTDVSKNALTESGQKLNKMDKAQAEGMPVDEFVGKMIRAIESNKSEVYIGGKETIGVWMKRFFPKRFERIIRETKVR